MRVTPAGVTHPQSQSVKQMEVMANMAATYALQLCLLRQRARGGFSLSHVIQ